MNTTAATDDNRSIVRTLAQDITFAKFKGEVTAIKDSGRRAHDANVDQPSVAFHDPRHYGQHLLWTRDVDDLQMADGIKGHAVVVAHMRSAIRSRLEIGGGSKERQV